MIEKQIIEGLKNKDENIFKFLVEKYKDKVYNTVLSILQNAEDAEDIAQEVFIQVYTSINNFRGNSSLSTWIYRISITKSFEKIRFKKRKKRFAFLINLFNKKNETIEIPDFYHPGVILEQKENSKILFQAIENLNEKQKKTYILHNIEGLSYKKISKITGLSIASIESLIHRAKKKLKLEIIKLIGNERNL